MKKIKRTSGRNVSKIKLIKALKALSLTAYRDCNRKKWVLSNGEEFNGLRDIARKYKIA